MRTLRSGRVQHLVVLVASVGLGCTTSGGSAPDAAAGSDGPAVQLDARSGVDGPGSRADSRPRVDGSSRADAGGGVKDRSVGDAQRQDSSARSDARRKPDGGGSYLCSSVDQLVDPSKSPCPPGYWCLLGDGTPPVVECADTMGTRKAYETCDDGTLGSGCAKGAGECMDYDVGPPRISRCVPFCNPTPGSPCPGAGICILSIPTVLGTVGGCLGPENCDLMTNQGCPKNLGCYVATLQGAKLCLVPGTTAAGQSCQYSMGCVPGHRCLGTPQLCRKLCKTTTDCVSPQTCGDIGQAAPGNTILGWCR